VSPLGDKPAPSRLGDERALGRRPLSSALTDSRVADVGSSGALRRNGHQPRGGLVGQERAGRLLAAGWRLGRANPAFSIALILAAALRVLVSLAYQPALELYGDSYAYLANARKLVPGRGHPLGYAVLLRALSPTGALVSVTIAQHALALGTAVVIYVLLLRLGVRPWLATLGTLPFLFDAYQLDIEQFILAETLLDILLVAGLTLLLWRPRPRAWQGALAAFFLAAATLTRTAAFPILIVAGLYLLIRWAWRPLLSGVAVALIVLVGYGGWYAATNGTFGLSDYTGFYLYGVVAPYATCDYPLSPALKQLCPLSSIAKRPKSDEFYVWAGRSRLYQGGIGTHHQRNELAERFSIQVIEHQPRDYLDEVAGNAWHYFAPGRWMANDQIDMQRWRFPTTRLDGSRHKLHVAFAHVSFNKKPTQPRVTEALTGPLRTYQSIVYTPGPLFLVCLTGGLLVAAWLIRGKRGAHLRQARWAALVMSASALALVVGPALVTGFSYRYQLPLLVLLPPAGIIAAEAGLERFWPRESRHLPVHGGQPKHRRAAGANGSNGG
jgi:hypothetical protein